MDLSTAVKEAVRPTVPAKKRQRPASSARWRGKFRPCGSYSNPYKNSFQYSYNGVMRSMRTVQMTLDRALLETVDRAARSLGTTRSAFTRKALTDALERMRVEALEQRHRRGYESHPARRDEFSGWEQEQAWPD